MSASAWEYIIPKIKSALSNNNKLDVGFDDSNINNIPDKDNVDLSLSDSSNDDKEPLGTRDGKAIVEAWNKRKWKLVSSHSITAWMLSPVEEIRAHVVENSNGTDRNAVEALIISF